MRNHTYKVKPGRMGCFLDPPGSPQYEYEVAERAGNYREVGWMSLESALDAEYVPVNVKLAIRKLYADATIVADPDWIKQVYAYFHNCYSPDGIDRNVSNCIIAKDGDKYPAECSLAYLHIRQWFPDHTPREDLL